jgi:phage terminase large subunit
MSLIEIDINPAVFLPVYRPLLTSDADIDMLWGGRDSGKSHFIAQKSVVDCLNLDYFRMALIKKTYESIRDSQYKTLIEIIDDWKVDELFRATKSPLEIHCINGNSFLARGCDNPQKIKSIRNPSHAWYEEADQLSENDYITASTSLRSNKGRVKEYLSFNPEADGDYKKHWIYKQFLLSEANRMYGTFKSEKEIKVPGEKKPVKIRFTSTHTTYIDNPYCTPERRAKLEDLKDTNPYYYLVYTKGRWGVRQVDMPFLFNFKREKHTGKCEWNPNQITYLSFDFNKNPICASVFQFYDDKIFGIETIKIANKGIDDLCQVIASRYPEALFIVTGDFSGYNRSALMSDDFNFFTAIQQNLGLEDTQIQVQRNPRIEENQVLMNKILVKMDVCLDEENANALIFDCMFAEILPNGTLKKGDREDPAQQLDALDTFRYFCNTIISPLLN